MMTAGVSNAGPVPSDHLSHQGETRLCRHVGRRIHPVPGRFVHADELRDLSIGRHQDPPFSRSALEERPVAAIVTELAGLAHIMPMAAQPLHQSLPGTPVDEKPQDFATDIADKLSRAIR